MRHPIIPFSKRPRKYRLQHWIGIKNSIRQQKDRHGGVFYTHQYIPNIQNAEEGPKWADVYFLGTKKGVFWNATLLTARHAWFDKLEDAAFQSAYQRLSEEEKEAEFDYFRLPTKNSKFCQLVFPERKAYPQFEGRTFDQEKKHYFATHFDSTLDVRESVAIDHGYGYGIGLTMVIDTPGLTVNTINAAIDRFLAMGEQNWVSAQPIPLERLQTTQQEGWAASSVEICLD